MLYAVPPYTDAVSLAFEDMPFRVEEFHDKDGNRLACAHCGSTESYLEECTTDSGETVWRCSDTEYCSLRQQAQPAVSVASPGGAL